MLVKWAFFIFMISKGSQRGYFEREREADFTTNYTIFFYIPTLRNMFDRNFL